MITDKQEKYQQVLSVAQDLCRQEPDWVTFFREVLGIEGLVRKAFPTFEELAEFEKSEEFETIQRMLVKLREKKISGDTDTEPTRVITVRLPKSMHEYLRTEAHDLRTSMNKLCISKLLQVVEQDMIPAEKSLPSRRRMTDTAGRDFQPSQAQPASGELPPGSHEPAPARFSPSVGIPPLKTNF